MDTKESIAVIEKITERAKQLAKPGPVKYGALAPGDYHRQGDVYFTKLPGVPSGCAKAEAQIQLAPGTTQGSRHCLESLRGVEFFRAPNATELDGPIVQCEHPITVNHPEHGTVTMPPGTYKITYQRQHAEELKRVRD